MYMVVYHETPRPLRVNVKMPFPCLKVSRELVRPRVGTLPRQK